MPKVKHLKDNWQALVDGVKAHAQEHYNEGGWDVVIECYTDEMIAAHLKEPDYRVTYEPGTYRIASEGWVPGCDGNSTVEQAIAKFAALVSIWDDRQQDAVNSAF